VARSCLDMCVESRAASPPGSPAHPLTTSGHPNVYRRIALPLLLVALGIGAAACSNPPRSDVAAASPPASDQGYLPLTLFYDLVADEPVARAALDRISADWEDAYATMLLDLIYFSTSPAMDAAMTRVLEEKSGIRFRGDYDPFYRWIWTSNPGEHPRYAEFMATLYSEIDPEFRDYFDDQPRTLIRLDEVLWGGVNQDGIPPLVQPKMLAAPNATYLDNDNIVFGVYLDGEARAYPKRILAWHEMVKDRIGDRELTGVYCTLCGAMILYDSRVDGTFHDLGTSGFLYRSNKLMYDKATSSLWSTLTGTPVIGPLVGEGIELATRPVVTTTWGEWRSRHPDTLVLSLDTGRERDYSEGAAYRDYFSTDRLMFAVPTLDRRLPNKAEVLALRYDGEPVAIAADFLRRTPVFQGRAGATDFVVFTDPSGANRVYDASGSRFLSWDGRGRAVSGDGREWTLSESALIAVDGTRKDRLAAHRAFWFGWYAQFPETRLIQRPRGRRHPKSGTRAH
jgi:hypothetical protein